MGFGLSPGVATGWSTNASIAPDTVSIAPATAPAQTIEPARTRANRPKRQTAARAKKQHRVVGVAAVTLVSLMIVGEGWRRMDEAARSAGGPTTVRSTIEVRPNRPPAPVDFTIPTTSVALSPGAQAFGYYLPEQLARREERLRANFRLTITIDTAPVGGGTEGKIVAEVRFASDDKYVMHATSTRGGEPLTFDIIQIGGARYVSTPDIARLGDRWVTQPKDLSFDIGERQILDGLRHWSEPGATYTGVTNIDGFPLDHFTIESSSQLKEGGVSVDSSGTPFDLRLVSEFLETEGDRVLTMISTVHVQVHYEEPVVAIDVPTNVVTEADLKAGR
jgi:hypothetical protein